MDKQPCVNRCEFMRFGEESFYCKLYDKVTLEIETYDDSSDKIVVLRCNKCIEEAEIGSNTVEEQVRKLKQRLGWTLDSFYSFKDDIESEATEMYRTLKEMAENEAKKDPIKDEDLRTGLTADGKGVYDED